MVLCIPVKARHVRRALMGASDRGVHRYWPIRQALTISELMESALHLLVLCVGVDDDHVAFQRSLTLPARRYRPVL